MWEKCVQKDDLTTLLQDLTAYDAIVLGTPVYWFHVSAQFKMLVDRLYCFMQYTDPETGEAVMKFEFPAGKKFVLPCPGGTASLLKCCPSSMIT
ncbi:MAG: NAD(P)H-dependent oxidoreductase [Desulfobacterales bacterium]